jgi:hypothetical protein
MACLLAEDHGYTKPGIHLRVGCSPRRFRSLPFNFGHSIGPFCPKDPKRDPRRLILLACESHLAREINVFSILVTCHLRVLVYSSCITLSRVHSQRIAFFALSPRRLGMRRTASSICKPIAEVFIPPTVIRLADLCPGTIYSNSTRKSKERTIVV